MSGALRRAFARMHARWGLERPDDDLRERRAGAVTGSGWHIRYQFGEEDGREYLEVFASHRMTNDRLYRIYADGDRELVGASLEPSCEYK